MQCSGITKARTHVSTFIKCADNMRRDSISLDWKRYIVDTVQRVGSSAAFFSNMVDHVWETRINFLGDKSLAEVRKSRTENTKGLNVKTIVDCDEFILTKKLEEFEPYKKGYDENAKRLFDNAKEDALKEASKVVTQLVSFVIDWTKNENDYQKNIKEDEDFDDFGPMLTIDAAYEKITRKRFAYNVLSRDFRKETLSKLLCIGTEIVECFKTRSWLFNDGKSISGKLPDDLVEKLKKVEQDLLEECKDDFEKTRNLEISIDKISGIIIRKIKEARSSKSDKSISSLIGNKGSGGNENVMKVVLPEEVKTSCYKEYMMWLYKLLFKLKMVLFNSRYVPINEDEEDKDTLLKRNTFYSELVYRTRIIEEIERSSPDNNKDEDEEAFGNKKSVLIYNYDDNTKENFENNDAAPNEVEKQDDDMDNVFKISFDTSSIKPKMEPVPGTQSQSSKPSILNNPFDSLRKSPPPRFIFGVSQPTQKPQQGPHVPTPPKYEPKPPSQPFNPPTMPLQPQQPQQGQYTPTPPKYEPRPPSQPFNPQSMPLQPQQQQQPQQGQYMSTPSKYMPIPPSQSFNPPSMPLQPPQQQQQQQEVPIGYQPQAMQQHPQSVAPFPQVKQQSAFVPQPHTFGPSVTKKVFAKSTFIPPKHVFKS